MKMTAGLVSNTVAAFPRPGGFLQPNGENPIAWPACLPRPLGHACVPHDGGNCKPIRAGRGGGRRDGGGWERGRRPSGTRCVASGLVAVLLSSPSCGACVMLPVMKAAPHSCAGRTCRGAGVFLFALHGISAAAASPCASPSALVVVAFPACSPFRFPATRLPPARPPFRARLS